MLGPKSRGDRRRLVPQLSQFKAEFFAGEVGVNELSTRLGVEQTTLSQQLAILRSRSVVVGRKSGSNVFYSIHDSAIFRLLDVARKIFNNHLVNVRDLLSQL
jgi:ArsR family transcriptional regulator